eukprot:4942396-Pyramimonas_sp.AAC.1
MGRHKGVPDVLIAGWILDVRCVNTGCSCTEAVGYFPSCRQAALALPNVAGHAVGHDGAIVVSLARTLVVGAAQRSHSVHNG